MVKSSTGENGQRNGINERRLIRWVEKMQKTKPGFRFCSRDINFKLKLTVEYVGNTLRWIPGVRNTKIKIDGGRTLWEILPKGVERND